MTVDLDISIALRPRIVVAASTFKFLQLPISVTYLKVFTTLRLKFSPLVPQWPCFAAISLATIGKPKLDFSLKLLSGF